MNWDSDLPAHHAPRLKCEQSKPSSPEEILTGRKVILILLGILASTGLVFWLLFAFDARREEVTEFTTSIPDCSLNGNKPPCLQFMSATPPWPAGAH